MAGKSKFFAEFKEFAMRGNVVDMAVGVVVGGAFGKISTSLVNDVIIIRIDGARDNTVSTRSILTGVDSDPFSLL